MSNRPQRAPWLLLCLLLIVVPASFSQAQASDSAPVKKQLPADVRAYKAAEAQGLGAVQVDGVMIDVAVLRLVRNTLSKADLIGM